MKQQAFFNSYGIYETILKSKIIGGSTRSVSYTNIKYKKAKYGKNANEDVNIILLRQESVKKNSESGDAEHINILQ
jgi:hypothetical protein